MKTKIALSLLFTFGFVFFVWPKEHDWQLFQIKNFLQYDSGWLQKIEATCKKIYSLNGRPMENDLSEWLKRGEASERLCFISVVPHVKQNLHLVSFGSAEVRMQTDTSEKWLEQTVPLRLVTPLAIAPLLLMLLGFLLRWPIIPYRTLTAFYLLTLYGLDFENLIQQIGSAVGHLAMSRTFWVVQAVVFLVSLVRPLKMWGFMGIFFGIFKPTLFCPIYFQSYQTKRKPLVPFFILQTCVLLGSFLILKINLLGFENYFNALIHHPPYFSLAFILGAVFYNPLRRRRLSTVPSIAPKFSVKKTFYLFMVVKVCFLLPQLLSHVSLIESISTWFGLQNSSSSFAKFFVTIFCQVATGNFSFQWPFYNVTFNNVMVDAWLIGSLISPFSYFVLAPILFSGKSLAKSYRLVWLVFSRPLFVVLAVYGIVEISGIKILEPVVFAFILFIFGYMELQKRNWQLQSSAIH